MNFFVALAAIMMTFLGTTLLGYFIHWFIHQKWSGPFYRAHMVHHISKYPPWDMESERYRGAGWSSSFFIFIPSGTTLLATLSSVLWVLSCPWWIYVIVAFEVLILGVMHEIVHTATHMREHWFHRIGARYWSLRKIHRIHHKNMRRNFGIIWFGWDRFLRTYKDICPPGIPSPSKWPPRVR